ncbi:probable E3 ubiquitin-protein ligase MARCH10 isoform X2 [Lacerta agilis]|uniref:probable E3 ubiquitin-protein ligase MARCH10 isoform X2 n=1 Tax=Lacerta agilis TaxID=80427 RepID=UPI0014191D63|nr:probable E3 ubiquitin-protein ligase MARCH10 isoform X2 [Lacerta agilis]
MYEAKERQKFISDAQYLREMQHKMDSEYQTSSEESSGCELKSAIKALGNKAEAKFPAIDKASVKAKQKSSTCSKKTEKSGPGPKKDFSAFQKPILSRRQRLNQRSFLENTDTENMKRVEGRGRKTPVLHGIAKTTKSADSQDVTGQRSGPVLKTKKKSPEKRTLIQTSKLNIDSKSLDRDLKKGNVLTAAQQPPTTVMDSAVQVANGPLLSSEPSNSNLPPIKNTPVRPREDDFYALLCANVEGSAEENDDTEDVNELEEEFLSYDISKSPPPDQNNRASGMPVAQAEQPNCDMGVGGDVRRAELSHRLPRQHSGAVEAAAEQPSAGQRKTRDQRNPHALEENNLSEEAHKNEGENSKSPHAESRPRSAAANETIGNLSSTEDWSGNNGCGRERQGFEANQRCYTGLVSSARPTVQRPPMRSAFNIPGSLAQPINRTETTSNVDVAAASMQTTELSGSPRFTVRRQLSPIRIRESFSATESCQSSSPTISTFEDSSLLEDSISNGLSSLSPSTTSHDEDNFLNSHSSSSSTDSSHPSLFRANFTAHLHMAGPLPDQVPIFLTVSDLRNQSSFVSSTTTCSSPSTKEISKPETDPEKLKKLQESLLAEDSEEEGDQCRICQIAGGSLTNPLLEPCGCGGTLRFVHQECLKTWLKAKIKSGAELGAVKTCELCKQSLTVDLDDFNVNDYYRNHQQSRAQDELMNSGLYLVLLLHLYEQRFAELMRLNYNQASRDRLSRQPRTEENQNSANSGNSG